MIKKRRVLAAAVAALAGFGMVAPGTANADPTCVVGTSTIAQCFPDPVLAKVVATEGNFESGDQSSPNVNGIFDEAHRNITRLQIDSDNQKSIRSLQGMQYLHRLQALENNAGTEVTDLTPLRNLTSLTALRLGGNFADLSPLSGLSNLEELEINSASKDFTSLNGLIGPSGFPKLKTLQIIANSPADDPTSARGGSLTSIDELRKLSSLNLKTLWLQGGFASVNALAGNARFPKLDYVEVDSPNLADANGLKDLNALNKLYIRYSGLSNMDWTRGLTNLSELNIGSTKMTNMNGLRSLPNLQHLYIDYIPLTNLDWIKPLTNLTSFGLYGSPVTDVSALKYLTNLTTLALRGNPSLSDISAIGGLTKIRSMSLESNSITNVSQLRWPNWDGDGWPSSVVNALSDQSVTLPSVSVKSSVQVRTAIDENGNYIKPSLMSPAGGSYDSQTGLTTWSGLSTPGKVSIGFEKDVKVASPSVNNGLVHFSGEINQPYTLDGTGNGDSQRPGAGSGAASIGQLPTPASVAPKFTQLTLANKGSLSVPSTVNAGSTYRFYTMNVTPAAKAKVDAGQSYVVYAFIYSDPVALTSDGHNTALQLKKDARGYYVDARIPDGYSGPHTIALVDPDGSIIGWSKVTVSAKGGATLATTGSSVSAIAVAGLLLLMAGAGFLLARRRV
ncbi:LPXTG cell wall anchor domain-containing protein [Bifidobacterium sp. ESL0769]|uniref:Ig-like domain-containing protein n=1 Tax=Bifidobacterium sp. ESL0769 TaxID=2983229 RepID=UPI0023F61BE8|nr:Ig-like domain-containing protein [Bifidobacterium sp. ESL0769]WEV67803.1 LPXTG cell wall anchor domain-containing protein [Bifidobacterium sp. ESL0769]